MDSVARAKMWMMIGYVGLILGGVIFIVLEIAGNRPGAGGCVAWGLGFGTAVYAGGSQAVKLLEKDSDRRRDRA